MIFPNIPRTLMLCLGLSLLLASPTRADEKLEALKSKTDRWIAVQQQLAKERADWKSDKVVLENSIATLEASKTNLAQKIDFLEVENSRWTNDRSKADAALLQHQKNEATSIDRIAAFEERIQTLAPSLPDPLKEKLATQLQKLAAASGANKPSTSNRIQTLLAILAQIDEFNNNLNYTHVIRELDSDETIDVRVMYWGLAFAYAVNGDNSRAWIIAPSGGKWTWTEQNQDAAAIGSLFDVYEKTTTPALINAPASLSRKEAAQ